jgi:hypothetical protein
MVTCWSWICGARSASVWPPSPRIPGPASTTKQTEGRLQSEDITRDRLPLRRYISTATEHGTDALTALRAAVTGNPWMPAITQSRECLHQRLYVAPSFSSDLPVSVFSDYQNSGPRRTDRSRAPLPLRSLSRNLSDDREGAIGAWAPPPACAVKGAGGRMPPLRTGTSGTSPVAHNYGSSRGFCSKLAAVGPGRGDIGGEVAVAASRGGRG